MNQQEIKQLETELWDSANSLRANSKLTAAEYKDPVLGLILLRYAQNRYDQAKVKIEASIPEGPRGKRAATKDDFLAAGAMMLPELSQFDYLADLPEQEPLDEAINEAMKLIEEAYPDLAGVLPRNYQELDTDLLRELIRVFNKDSVKNISGDVFGRIYEFFLMKFSMDGAGAQEGGEFFTPPSLVQLIVNMIKPDHGIIHDPACGSAGMFVQTGHFIEEQDKNVSINQKVTCYGSELKSNNTRLAKMNLAIHGIEGKIIESNSFYSDPHALVGKCDFVMANPPFNVKKVDKKKDYVKTDVRLFDDIGIPKADNGNYLWIQYFYHYLNEQGRAGFVMASSATDAGNTEKAIRQKLVETGAVDCIVAVGNNFFYTRSLPCHVWFLDKGKTKANKDKILMIDARNTFRVVTSTINDYSPGQLTNFNAIMESYRGDESAIEGAQAIHNTTAVELAEDIAQEINVLRAECKAILKAPFTPIADSKCKECNEKAAQDDFLLCEKCQKAFDKLVKPNLDFSSITAELDEVLSVAKESDFEVCQQWNERFNQPVEKLFTLVEQYQAASDKALQAFKELEQQEKTTKDNKQLKKQLDSNSKLLKQLTLALSGHKTLLKQELADYKQLIKDWRSLCESFPENKYRDVEGLCKIVDRVEVAENDYSLSPGRYVGYSLTLDQDFDYSARMREIRSDLKQLNDSADQLMDFILEFDA
ncbi:type I restriction enzyme M protein [Vibrio crassostreae]|uniref:type I restriction-modification system subunit M n=1 Tax=Vibrio crassostreae TaxID=246167 RepID=UPI0006332866|nr:class I SAM-dependent DNA methyltransferase [Vibrio crassostreae]CAK1704358.1 type I restriction enzyme M protein [Vibrio crassostreae]CAK1710461.1 type I restriction enzyme M protein [Vibrio crassostreae]CAK1996075.1 type I restriction enzyme M protein [Vibrio crassostreae]CAK2004913.1 type I restriction enzyme M protein [Vibrio crassostreae]CAK2006378.1 type I restriction enzyme M protein [Vibrio crassostreae]